MTENSSVCTSTPLDGGSGGDPPWGVAQSVRAAGLYPVCRRFESFRPDGFMTIIDFLPRAPVEKIGAFVMSIFMRRTRHQQATPPRGSARLSPMVPVGSYFRKRGEHE